MSTYAWFTQNRQVSIDTITAKVSAAEGLQISLDATTWNTSITVDAASLAAAGQVSAAAQTNAGKLSWPKDLEPVSTIGEVASADVVFQKGRYVSGTDLESIANSPLSSEDYIAFDIYLKNSSSPFVDGHLRETKMPVSSSPDVASTCRPFVRTVR